MKIRLLAFIAICFLIGSQQITAQNIDSDFARRIRPEYKVDLTPKNIELPTAHKKSEAELKAENAYYQAQIQKTKSVIAELDDANTPKQDPQYVKYQLTLKMLAARNSEVEQKLKRLDKK